MKRTDKEKLVQFWMDKEDFKKFETKCVAKGHSKSKLFRVWIEKFMKESE